jgi:hypothetical protein
MGCKPNEEVKRTPAGLFLERFKTVGLRAKKAVFVLCFLEAS